MHVLLLTVPANCRSPLPRLPNLVTSLPLSWKMKTQQDLLSTTMMWPFLSTDTPLGPISFPEPILFWRGQQEVTLKKMSHIRLGRVPLDCLCRIHPAWWTQCNMQHKQTQHWHSSEEAGHHVLNFSKKQWHIHCKMCNFCDNSASALLFLMIPVFKGWFFLSRVVAWWNYNHGCLHDI